MQPLASSGKARVSANTNMSTSISLSLIDQNGADIPIHATADQPIELMIPRDPNLIVPSFQLQNLSSITKHNRTFNLHFINLTRNNQLPVAVHLHVHPLDRTRAYWLIYRFDTAPLINASTRLIDGWTLLCPHSQFFSLFLFFLHRRLA
jgi:hypothetical protein